MQVWRVSQLSAAPAARATWASVTLQCDSSRQGKCGETYSLGNVLKRTLLRKSTIQEGSVLPMFVGLRFVTPRRVSDNFRQHNGAKDAAVFLTCIAATSNSLT